MKNKDLIEKSIRENIVNHKTVLNNLKAKAASSQPEGRAVPAYRIGLRRAALVFALLAFLAAGAIGSAHLFGSGGDIVPPDVSCGNQNNEECSDKSQSSCGDASADMSSGTESIIDESRDTHGVDESGSVITRDPLDEETALFFSGVTEKYNLYLRLASNSLRYDNTYVPDPPDFNYRPVTDESLNSLQEIEDFVYDLLIPAVAAADYASLTLVENPPYIEINGVLFMDMAVGEEALPVIHNETAYFIYTSDDRMAISVKISRYDIGQEYYVRFSFTRVDGEWKLDNKPC